eukprot:IDg20317t1
MNNAKLFLATLVPFLLLDGVMIATVVRPMFKHTIPQLLSQTPSIPAAIIWYVLYVSGIVFFAVSPAVQRGQPTLAVLNGGVLGAVSYGTYELTNLALLKSWTW